MISSQGVMGDGQQPLTVLDPGVVPARSLRRLVAGSAAATVTSAGDDEKDDDSYQRGDH